MVKEEPFPCTLKKCERGDFFRVELLWLVRVWTLVLCSYFLYNRSTTMFWKGGVEAVSAQGPNCNRQIMLGKGTKRDPS